MGGLFGVAKKNCWKNLIYGLDYHSHLATEYGGLAISTENGIFKSSKYIGDSQFKSKFKGRHVLGTYGIGTISEEQQPACLEGKKDFALVTDSCISNIQILIEKLKQEGISFSLRRGIITNANILAKLINKEKDFVSGIKGIFSEIKGDCSLLLLSKEGIYAARDKYGLRPLVLGEKEDSYAIATEVCSFPNLGYKIIKYLEPGEIIFINENGWRTEGIIEGSKLNICAFLWAYFGNPASSYEGTNAEETRYKIGTSLTRQDNIKADIIAGVPNSGTAYAIGYANESGIPFKRPLIRYDAGWSRSYMPPIQAKRDEISNFKLNPIPSLIKDKVIVLVDDSIRRGTQMRKLLANKIWPFEPKEVHVRIGSPPQFYPCLRGEGNPNTLATRKAVAKIEGKENITDADIVKYMDENSESHTKMIEQIRKEISATSLKFVSLKDMISVSGIPKENLCLQCWTGKDYSQKTPAQ